MLRFTFAIYCLTTSNLPWFMDLTFHFPMQYCSLQYWTLLLSQVTFTTGYCFCFGSIPSFFLELFLHWSPVACWAPPDLGSSSQYPIILPFHTVHGVLKARILKWFAIPFSSGPHSVKSDWLYSLQPKMEKLYTVSKNKTRSWLWLRPWTPYCQIQTEIEESRENH